MSELEVTQEKLPTNVYKPSEIIGIFNSILAKQSVNAQVVYLRGVYLANPKQGNWSYCYDTLRDEDSQEELTLQITHQQRENLKNGNLVSVGGVLNRSISSKGYIQIILKVSRIEIVKEQAIDEAEIKRMELRQKKATVGFKNVDSILEGLLFTDNRPKVALVFAATSITLSDFEAGINAAKSAIDFEEYRANFSNVPELIGLLRKIDASGFDVIAIIRGGGGGIEKLDDLTVLEAIVNLATPTIGAIGHVEEKLFIKQLVDKAAPTPNGLGQYFSEMVETVNEKKTRSRAVLTEQIRKQFKDQLEAGQKQSKELQEKLAALTKNQEATQKLHKEQVEAMGKQNQELQKKLSDITKANETAQKQQSEAMVRLQAQMKEQREAHAKQQQEFNASLKKMQETNGELNKSLSKLTVQNAQAAKDLNDAGERQRQLERQLQEAVEGKSNVWMWVAIVAIIGALILLFTR